MNAWIYTCVHIYTPIIPTLFLRDSRYKKQCLGEIMHRISPQQILIIPRHLSPDVLMELLKKCKP